MPTTLTQKAVNAAIAAGGDTELVDTRARGLAIRIRNGKWSWHIRRSVGGNAHRFILGGGWTLDEARGLAFQFETMVAEGSPPWREGRRQWDIYLTRRQAERAGVTVETSPPERYSPHLSDFAFWEGIDGYIAEVARTRRETTAEGYKWSLQVAELKQFRLSRVREISRSDLAVAVKAIAQRGAERQAELTAAALRGYWKYLGSDVMTAKTGVAAGIMRDLRAPERTLVEDDDDDGDNTSRVPVADDVARIMRWLRDDASPALERDRLAGQLLVYSAQRRRAVALARKIEFEPAGDLGGLWRVPAMHRKSASVRRRRGGRQHSVGAHVVPLPPQAWAIVKRAMALAGDSEWLFPAVKVRKAGGVKKSMAPATLTHLFADVVGNDCSPHSMRRAFGTTYAEVADLDLPQTKTILDHSEGVKSGDVTKEHYAFRDGTHRKWPIVRGWCDWVDAAAERGPV